MITCKGCGSSDSVGITRHVDAWGASASGAQGPRWSARCGSCETEWDFVDEP